MLVRCSLKNYVLRKTAVIVVYGEPMELPRCGAEKICALVPRRGEQLAAPELEQVLDRGAVSRGGGVVQGVVSPGVGCGGRGLVAEQVLYAGALHVEAAHQVQAGHALAVLVVHARPGGHEAAEDAVVALGSSVVERQSAWEKVLCKD